MPTASTGYAACYVADAKPVRGESQTVVRSADSATPVSSTSREDDRSAQRRVARSRWDRDDDYGPDAEDSDGPPSYRDAPPSERNPRYAGRADGPWGRDARNDDDDRAESDWRDGPAYDDGPYDDEGPDW
jgi:hypothetical protein